VNLELRNYIETQGLGDYNVLDVRRLMVVRSSMSYRSTKTQNGGAALEELAL